MRTIDLNADLGEGEACDADLLTIVTSCNIACGGHAGDFDSMTETLVLALRAGVVVGAHPSYPDRDGFGRRSNFLGGEALYESLSSQVTEFADLAGDLGAALAHVKPHGALYNDAADDDELADILARVTDEAPGHAMLVGLPGSLLQAAAARHGVGFVAEGFVDRAYAKNGSLLPRTLAGAVHTDPERSAQQALTLARDGSVECATGEMIPMRVDTLCIHGDTPDAVTLARTVRQSLEQNGVAIAALGADQFRVR